MEPTQKKRVNLYIEQQLLDFGKLYSYVMGESLSSLIENYLRHEEEKTKILSAEQFISFNNKQDDEWYIYSGKSEEDDINSIKEFLVDKEEVEYCKKNPNSIRAKLRIQLINEQDERDRLNEDIEAIERERQKIKRQEFIKRWSETFK